MNQATAAATTQSSAGHSAVTEKVKLLLVDDDQDNRTGYALLLATSLGLADRFSPQVADYWARLQTREGFQRAKAAQKREAAAQGVGRAPV